MRELSSPNTVADAIFGAVADHSRPLLTYYDEATGERTDLSAATLGNWAAKTANYLVDEIGVGAGDVVVVDLPEHWQTAGIVIGALWAGTDVHLADADAAEAASEPRVVFTSRDRLDDHPDADEVVVASLDPFALPLRDLPPGVGDYGSVVRVHGDQFVTRSPAVEALDGMPTAEVVTEARTVAERDGIAAGTRVVSTRPWHTARGVLAHLLAPLIAGGSLVHVANASAERVAAIADVEKAGVVLGIPSE
ncbi:TIGR03089 family protein [Gordonia amicalis]|uniref:TIGR03089 family protein n=1 Tax=Gordonia amicalis TaxID=89053 RepID=A0AAE4R1P0_9ACTN|nr:TIGR03089 family protein [Gordonia amicalis]MDV6310791.1 TIGR03089 family protein [Gordonia amicalis]